MLFSIFPETNFVFFIYRAKFWNFERIYFWEFSPFAKFAKIDPRYTDSHKLQRQKVSDIWRQKWSFTSMGTWSRWFTSTKGYFCNGRQISAVVWFLSHQRTSSGYVNFVHLTQFAPFNFFQPQMIELITLDLFNFPPISGPKFKWVKHVGLRSTKFQ